ncbi:gamma carbonic anhydrase family protein [Fluoribacter dumoffii]|uniref:Carnitine operon protein CaiE n=1 Tax=Fluoribacter dumoffii TaxID=463 RepID=A0A377GCX0_9GAMM|nr:gamma carbonic anhydrase family protein [Fluoribacter dumoffii]KTC90766.1 transferase [Fluoribacter dumoffii NY 23]MCW8386446.1 gamma carbonic anhydrase family protein [Fluoribacter dumoffii]MCW8419499.1 gamma carbonic anhydrase family protein [Fluoribacter dumoffii]MCW8452626.1 gamma carbonic anhydrase family protein [Fluoribacter dumoffii]MCW8460123.1 gamma carbonic anhydrase family protein [Fluoribacter dumoffii]
MNDAIRSFQGKWPSIGQRVFIDPKSVVIGDVLLGDDVSVWPMAVIRGDVNSIKVGNACSIQDGAVLHVTHDGPYTSGGQPLILGQGITIGHRAVLHGCMVDDFCLIGMGALILDAVHIQHHVMVAAGSVVTPGKLLESGYLYLGNPAKAVRKLTDQEMEMLEYSAQHYVRLKDKHLVSI